MWLHSPSPAVILIGDQGRCYTQFFIYDGPPYNLLVHVLVLNSDLFTDMCCFTGSKGIALLPQCYWCNPEKYGWSQPSQNHNKSQQIMNSVLIWLGKLPWKPLLLYCLGVLYLSQVTTTHLKIRGCFTNVSRALQNNIAKIYSAKIQIYGENSKLTLYVCPKPCFGHTYKVSAWNFHKKHDFCNTQISREYSEELAKHLCNNPQAPVPPIDGCPIFKWVSKTCMTGYQDSNPSNGHQVTCPMEYELYMFHFVFHWYLVTFFSYFLSFTQRKGEVCHQGFCRRDICSVSCTNSFAAWNFNLQMCVCHVLVEIQSEMISRHVDSLMQDCCISSASALKMKFCSLAQGVQLSGKSRGNSRAGKSWGKIREFEYKSENNFEESQGFLFC